MHFWQEHVLENKSASRVVRESIIFRGIFPAANNWYHTLAIFAFVPGHALH